MPGTEGKEGESRRTVWLPRCLSLPAGSLRGEHNNKRGLRDLQALHSHLRRAKEGQDGRRKKKKGYIKFNLSPSVCKNESAKPGLRLLRL